MNESLANQPALTFALAVVAVLFPIAFIYFLLKRITGISAHINIRRLTHQRLQQNTIIAEYTPPGNLSPAELGYIFDNKLTDAEVFGTIVYLQNLDFITIGESKNGKLYIDRVNPGSEGLNKFEAAILELIPPDERKWITKKYIAMAVSETGPVLEKQLTQKGYIISSNRRFDQAFIRHALIVIGLWIIFPLGFFQFVTTETIKAMLLLSPVITYIYVKFAKILYKSYFKIAGEPWYATDKLKKVWPDVEGYRTFIQVVEADRFTYKSDELKGVIKHEALPYAIALGFNTGWQKQLQ